MKKNQNIKKIKTPKLNQKDISKIPRAYDVLGDMMIFSDFPSELQKKEKQVAEYVMSLHKNIKVVLKKTKKYSGTFRTPKLKILGGERRKDTIYRENNARMQVNPEKMYFSSRLSTERKRICEKVKEGEDILVMFSGAGPYPIVLAKNTQAKTIYGIEINPDAHEYALKNAEMNKIHNINFICGDVNTILPKIKKKFDRIIMPLPKDAHDFLGLALQHIKKTGIIHLYDFAEEKDIPEEVKLKIEKACKMLKKKYKIKEILKCGQYGPHKFRICTDFQIL